ncbi:MAG: hypothetical protein GXP27_22010, partial [Planctomycetes bacterium]|nr:hypothetical protein [Planctomycetota bacterium]
MREPKRPESGPPDLISAYYDGEVGAAERELAERLLSSSADATKELEDYRRLGRLLRELPQEELPEEFASMVLQAAERQMLLSPETAVVPGTKRFGPGRWTGRRIAAVVATVAAACLVLLLFWPRRANLPREVAFRELPPVAADQTSSRTDSSRAPTTEPAAEADALLASAAESAGVAPATRSKGSPSTPPKTSDEARVAVTDQFPAVAALEKGEETGRIGPTSSGLTKRAAIPSEALSGAVPAQPPQLAARRAGKADSPSPMPGASAAKRATGSRMGHPASTSVASAPAPKPADLASPPVKPQACRSSRHRWHLRFDRRTLSEAQVGQVIEALATAEEGQVAVVRLTVVDRRRGLESLQLLLAQNQIVREGAEPRALAEQVTAETGSDQLVAVYVESTTDRLSAALKALQRDGLFRELAVESPIQMALLDQAARRRIQGTRSEKRSKALDGKVPPVARQPSAPVRKARGLSRLADVRGQSRAEPAEAEKKGDASLAKAVAPEQASEKVATRPESQLADEQTGRKKRPEVAASEPALPPESPDKSTPLVSRQLALTLPADLVPILGQCIGDEKDRARRTRQSLGKKLFPTSPASEPLSVSARTRRPLQVLFVLVPNGSHPAHSPTLSPSAPENSGPGSQASDQDNGA